MITGEAIIMPAYPATLKTVMKDSVGERVMSFLSPRGPISRSSRNPLKIKQMIIPTKSATREMMMRFRSSSRCPMRDNIRSSVESVTAVNNQAAESASGIIGFRTLGLSGSLWLRCHLRFRCRHRLPGGLSRLRLLDFGCFGLVLGYMFLKFRGRFLEFLDALAQRLADLRQPLRPEDHQHYY